VPEQERHPVLGALLHTIRDWARQLVEEATATGPIPPTRPPPATPCALQEIVQQQLATLGLWSRSPTSRRSNFFGETTPNGDFQMAEFAWIATPEPDLTTFRVGQHPRRAELLRYENGR